MAGVMQGYAIVWGVGSVAHDTTAGDSWKAATGVVVPQSFDWSLEADKAEAKDSNGDTVALYFTNYRRTGSMKYIVGEDGSSGAPDPNDRPYPGQRVTLVANDATYAGNANYNAAADDGDIEGTWICESVSKSRSIGEVVEFDISLVQHTGLPVGQIQNWS